MHLSLHLLSHLNVQDSPHLLLFPGPVLHMVSALCGQPPPHFSPVSVHTRFPSQQHCRPFREAMLATQARVMGLPFLLQRSLFPFVIFSTIFWYSFMLSLYEELDFLLDYKLHAGRGPWMVWSLLNLQYFNSAGSHDKHLFSDWMEGWIRS